MMLRTLLTLLSLLMLGLLAACGDGGGPRSVPEVDRVVEAVRNRDESAIANLVEYHQVACSSASVDLSVTPECRFGEEEGTLVDVVKFAQCEEAYLRVGDVPNAVQHLLDPGPQVYAAFEAPDTWELGDYAVVLTSSEQGRPVATEIVLEGGKIVVLDFGCGERPEERVKGIPEDSFIIGPGAGEPSPEGS